MVRLFHLLKKGDQVILELIRTLGQVWYLIISFPDLCTLTYCNMVNKLFEPRTVFCFLRIVPFVNPFRRQRNKDRLFFSSGEMFVKPL